MFQRNGRRWRDCWQLSGSGWDSGRWWWWEGLLWCAGVREAEKKQNWATKHVRGCEKCRWIVVRSRKQRPYFSSSLLHSEWCALVGAPPVLQARNMLEIHVKSSESHVCQAYLKLKNFWTEMSQVTFCVSLRLSPSYRRVHVSTCPLSNSDRNASESSTYSNNNAVFYVTMS